MSIAIHDTKTIKDIQKEFHDKFNHLKIEFYTQSHSIKEGSPEQYIVPHEKTIGDARSVHNEGEISIDGHVKVSNLEKLFHDKFGLNVQVFRKSGNTWLQTTRTDEWTLSEQNRAGHE